MPVTRHKHPRYKTETHELKCLYAVYQQSTSDELGRSRLPSPRLFPEKAQRACTLCTKPFFALATSLLNLREGPTVLHINARKCAIEEKVPDTFNAWYIIELYIEHRTKS